MKRTSLSLDDDELIWLKRMIADQDGEEAFRFANQFLRPCLREAERITGLQRTFEAGGPPGQTGRPG